MRSLKSLFVLAWALGVAEHPAPAQQDTGTLGSPSAMTTIPGNQLPPPMKFGGVINQKAVDSKPFWPHVLALQIILLVMIFSYCVIRKLGRALGEERMFLLFFRDPLAVRAF
jgi:hypothetical protein